MQDYIESLAETLHMKIGLKKVKANRALAVECLRDNGGKTSQELNGGPKAESGQTWYLPDPQE